MIVENSRLELPHKALTEINLREWDDSETEALAGLLQKHHYLGCPDPRRRHLCQVACWGERPVALLVWSTAAAKLVGREQFVGWDNRTRQKRLGYIVQNCRFLLLPEKRPDNL
ncbi:MAG: Druantia anti-phage system protein DruA, partial [Verrucomicrobiota bacterium]